MQFHPYAELFPLLDDAALADLAADIKLNGQVHPIILYEGKILDGRNRWRACNAAGVEPRFDDLAEGLDPLSFVVSTNFIRRHMSESQRAMAASKIEAHSVSHDDAKAMFKVTSAALKQAEIVNRDGTPELIAAVLDDRIPVNIAAKLSAMPADAQNEATGLNPIQLRSVVKKQLRLKKTASLARATARETKKLGEKLYPVIYADPPWRLEAWSENGLDRGAENHYETMTTQAIMDMKCPATKNAVLFMWVTTPMLEAGIDVLKAWGFEYKSNFVWVKDRMGLGRWNRNRHEHLLVATRGTMPPPAGEDKADSVFEEPVNGHSEKPDAVRDLITSWYPTLDKIELFARRESPGWESHGNELPASDDEEVQAA